LLSLLFNETLPPRVVKDDIIEMRLLLILAVRLLLLLASVVVFVFIVVVVIIVLLIVIIARVCGAKEQHQRRRMCLVCSDERVSLSFSLFFLFETKLCQLFFPQNPQKSEMSISLTHSLTETKKSHNQAVNRKNFYNRTREED